MCTWRPELVNFTATAAGSAWQPRELLSWTHQTSYPTCHRVSRHHSLLLISVRPPLSQFSCTSDSVPENIHHATAAHSNHFAARLKQHPPTVALETVIDLSLEVQDSPNGARCRSHPSQHLSLVSASNPFRTRLYALEASTKRASVPSL
jgi:hypothetical protein